MIKKIKIKVPQSATKRVEAQKLIQESVDRVARPQNYDSASPKQAQHKSDHLESSNHKKEEKVQEKLKKDVTEIDDQNGPHSSLLPSTSKPQKSDLEETLSREKTKELSSDKLSDNSQYVLELSQTPIRSLKKEMADIYLAVEEKGYLNREEERQVHYLSSAVERKLEDIESGKYSLTEEAAQAVSLTQKLGSALHDIYHHGKKAKRDDHDLYFRSE